MILGVTTDTSAQTFTYYTIAGGTQGTNNGANAASQFSYPVGVAVDTNRDIYVADQINNSIRKIFPIGTNWIAITIAGGARGYRDGVGTNAEFSGPTGIAADNMTNLYVADQYNYTIRQVSLSGSNWVVSTIAGQAGVAGFSNGPNTNAQFYNPAGIALDSAGNIFVADEFNNAIREIMPDGGNWLVSTIAGGTSGHADGTNSAAQFNKPAGVAVDASGRAYVSDQFNNTIRLLTPSGSNWVVTTIAGDLTAGAGDGLGTNARFQSPQGIVWDTNGNVYVADLFNNAVRESDAVRDELAGVNNSRRYRWDQQRCGHQRAAFSAQRRSGGPVRQHLRG